MEPTILVEKIESRKDLRCAKCGAIAKHIGPWDTFGMCVQFMPCGHFNFVGKLPRPIQRQIPSWALCAKLRAFSEVVRLAAATGIELEPEWKRAAQDTAERNVFLQSMDAMTIHRKLRELKAWAEEGEKQAS